MNTIREVRVDKFLWAVRLYKTRALAAEACRGGHVLVNSVVAKASRSLRVDDIIQARAGGVTRTVKISALTHNRVAAAMVGNFIEDKTPAEEYLRQIKAKQEVGPRRPKGAGRPTKRERRQLERMYE